MIRITKTQEWDFEMPKSCSKCPMSDSYDSGEGFWIECCNLKKALDKSGDWTKHTIDYRTMREQRDKNCPLVDGKTYNI